MCKYTYVLSAKVKTTTKYETVIIGISACPQRGCFCCEDLQLGVHFYNRMQMSVIVTRNALTTYYIQVKLMYYYEQYFLSPNTQSVSVSMSCFKSLPTVLVLLVVCRYSTTTVNHHGCSPPPPSTITVPNVESGVYNKWRPSNSKKLIFYNIALLPLCIHHTCL